MSIINMVKQNKLDAEDAGRYREMLRSKELEHAYTSGLDSGQMEALARFSGIQEEAYNTGIQEGAYLGEQIAMARTPREYIVPSRHEQQLMDANMDRGYNQHRQTETERNRRDADIIPNIAKALGRGVGAGSDHITDAIFNAQGERP